MTEPKTGEVPVDQIYFFHSVQTFHLQILFYIRTSINYKAIVRSIARCTLGLREGFLTEKGCRPMDFTIKILCKKFGLSRSTLLYYDSIGLLKPAKRTEANYRKYTEADVKQLERICMYRQAGLPLLTIKQILTAADGEIKDALEQKYRDLNNQISIIREQQGMLVELMKNQAFMEKSADVDKAAFARLLHQAGLSRDNMNRLHTELEQQYPAWHSRFLELLGMDEAEIEEIKCQARLLAGY